MASSPRPMEIHNSVMLFGLQIKTPVSHENRRIRRKKHRCFYIRAHFSSSSQRGCAVVNESSAVQFYCPRATGLSPTYMTYLLRSCLPMAGVAQRLKSRFGHFLALTVPSAVGFAPFPSMLRPDGNPSLRSQPHDITELKLCSFSSFCHYFFRKVTYFTKRTASPVSMRVCGIFS